MDDFKDKALVSASDAVQILRRQCCVYDINTESLIEIKSLAGKKKLKKVKEKVKESGESERKGLNRMIVDDIKLKRFFQQMRSVGRDISVSWLKTFQWKWERKKPNNCCLRVSMSLRIDNHVWLSFVWLMNINHQSNDWWQIQILLLCIADGWRNVFSKEARLHKCVSFFLLPCLHECIFLHKCIYCQIFRSTGWATLEVCLAETI